MHTMWRHFFEIMIQVTWDAEEGDDPRETPSDVRKRLIECAAEAADMACIEYDKRFIGGGVSS